MILLAIGQPPREISDTLLSALPFGELDLAYLQKIRHLPSLGRSIGCRKLLEQLCLQAHLPRASLRIDRDDQNRPFFPALSYVDFNISHAQDLCAAVLILSADLKSAPRIGVDLECVQHHARHERLCRKLFSPLEQEEYDAIGTEGFCKIWTRKEALAKHTGVGISELFYKEDALALATQRCLNLFTQRISLGDQAYYLTVCTSESQLPPIQIYEVTDYEISH